MKLVYWFYAPKMEFPLIYDYHFACLKQYINLFDDIVILLAVDDIYDVEHINNMERLFLDFNISKNISFKIYKNNPELREAEGFKKEVVDKLYDTDQLVFFAHSKGFTNIMSPSLKYWIAAMYYFNLSDIYSVKHYLRNDLAMFYGHVAMRGPGVSNKYNWHYPGSFYWLNPSSIAAEAKHIPNITNRFYAEMFPGMITDMWTGQFRKAAWPGKYFLEGDYNFYINSRYYLSLCFSEEDMKKLDEFVSRLDIEINLKSN